MSKARLVLRAANRSSLPIINAVVARERPAEPLVCLRPATVAAALLRAARPHAARLGIAFHVGSQCLDPAVYAAALRLAADAVAHSEVAVDIVDIGGGFPVSYPDTVPPPLDAYVAAIADGARVFPAAVRLWAEP